MCAGLRLGCKDSSGNHDYIFCFHFKKSNKNRYYSSVRGVTHTAVFKAEMVRRQAAGSVILQGWICRSPSCTYRRGSIGLVSRHLSSSKKSAEGSAAMADMGLNGNNPL